MYMCMISYFLEHYQCGGDDKEKETGQPQLVVRFVSGTDDELLKPTLISKFGNSLRACCTAARSLSMTGIMIANGPP